MTRKVTIFLSLVAVVVGVWLVSTEHSIAMVCSTTPRTGSGIGIGDKCVSAVSTYFIGVALMSAGVVIVILALLLLEKRDITSYRKQKTTISKLHREEAERRRKAA